MGSYMQPNWPSWGYTDVNETYSGYPQYSNYSSYLADSMDAYQAHHHHLVHHHQMSRTTESKPRLSKEEVEVLEAEFQKNHKPNSSTKKALAESMRVENARINNWFQNRRAREKKERNIREYEIRQKLDKEKSGSSAPSSIMSGHQSDLVASSAPFPNTQRPVSVSDKRATSMDMEQDGTSDENACSSPAPSPANFASLGVDGDPSRFTQTSPSNDTSGTNDNDFALSTDEEDATFFSKQAGQQSNGHYGPGTIFDYGHVGVNGFPPSQSPEKGMDGALKSPAMLDIASRRNRRPPPLSINEARSYSAGAPRTGIDVTRRRDVMRRVASATGSMRVSKPMGAPRSPFQLSRSPVTAGPRGSNAPPTPDTPILASHNSNAPEMSSDLALARDPTLKTPPATPGLSQNFFSLNSVYNMAMPDEQMVNPSGGSYPNGFDVSGMPLGMSSFASTSGSCVNQAQTSFISPVSTGSYGLSASSTEYNWPSSRNVSPTSHQPGPQYLNLPVSTFGVDR